MIDFNKTAPQTIFLAIVFLLCLQADANAWDRDYFFHDFPVNEEVTDPADFMGFDPGEWHPGHYQVEMYLRELSETSPRVERVEIGRSHQYRPMSVLIITSPENHERLEELRQCHLAAIDPENHDCPEGAFNPLVLYQSYTSHGNEPSGTGAALLYGWYLAASQEAEVERILDETVIILDACMNPDGYQRFVNWVNNKRSTGGHLVTDPNDDEFNEPWPRSRTNHYWFDLNRDWLPVQHPESVGKIRMFQSWKPNVLTDHHEMGSNATYFFQPGIPSRTNPMTPEINQELTAALAEYHAKALDELSVPYYTRERFDDYYYGKGSTYPDIQGCVGILFEQASSRGHKRETIHGDLSFAETIRNQLATSLSTLRGSWDIREELKDYQTSFFREAYREAEARSSSGYLVSLDSDPYRRDQFIKMLLTQEIDVYENRDQGRVEYYIPLRQLRYNLVRTVFETVHEFPDSLFYDVSTWTMTLAYGIDAQKVSLSSRQAEQFEKLDYESFELGGTYEEFPKSKVAYVFRWSDFRAPGLVYHLLEKGVRAKAAFSPFSVETHRGLQTFQRGSILILPGAQEISGEKLHQKLDDLASERNIGLYAATGGLTKDGPDLGSPTFRMLNPKSILMVTGNGVNANKAGEIWYYFDRHLGIPITKVSTDRINRVNLKDYDVIIVPTLGGSGVNSSQAEKLLEFVRAGNTLILEGNASRWAASQNISDVEVSSLPGRPDTVHNYAHLGNAFGALAVGGCILKAHADLTHPLLFGYENETLHIFKRKRWTLNMPGNKLAAPLYYDRETPLASGYLHERHVQEVKGQASVIAESNGRGHIIHLSDGPFFRGYWYGNAHLLSNAVFFGGMINRRGSL